MKNSLSGFGIRDSGRTRDNYFTQMSSGSEAASYLRLIDFVYHSTLGLRVIKKKDSGFGIRDGPEPPVHLGKVRGALHLVSVFGF